MRCSNCYREIPGDALYCPYCGEAHPGAGMRPRAEVPPRPQHDEPRTEKQVYEPGPENVRPEEPFREEQPEAREVHGIPYTYGNGGTGTAGGPEQNSYHVPVKKINWVPYLVLAIISTICCCPPFGIVAIVYAAKINS